MHIEEPFKPCCVCLSDCMCLQFNEMREEARGQSPLLTLEQQNWITVQVLISQTQVEVSEGCAHEVWMSTSRLKFHRQTLG